VNDLLITLARSSIVAFGKLLVHHLSWLGIFLTSGAVLGPVKSGNRVRTGKRLLLPVLFLAGLDAVLIAALPALHLSYGPVLASIFFFTAPRLVGSACLLFCWIDPAQRWSRPQSRRLAAAGLIVLILFNIGWTALVVDGFYIEPFNLQVNHLQLTHLQLPGPVKASGRPFRLLQISDTHVEYTSPRERNLVEQVDRLQPDLIVLTGDYANIDYLDDAQTREDTRRLLSQLHAPSGIYAVSGSPAVDRPDVVEAVFSGLENVTRLDDEVRMIPWEGGELFLVGIRNRGLARDGAVLADLKRTIPEGAFTILLYHSPDLIGAAVENQVDLYLAGHTHGGQVRVPIYGALVTFSAFGKQYEMGRYRVDETTLYVSRGVGLEGLGLPRIRLLCPPEIVLVELAA
jgi:predicted MPP superfamily phosphohydrolase